MDYSKFDWSGGDIGNLEPYQLPKGSTSASLGDMTGSILSKLGSGILAGQAGGASLLASANPYAAAAQMGSQALKAGFDAAGRPDDLKGTAGNGAQRGGGMHAVHIVNFGGTQTANASADGDRGDKSSGMGGGPNYWLIGGLTLAGLVALKMMKG